MTGVRRRLPSTTVFFKFYLLKAFQHKYNRGDKEASAALLVVTYWWLLMVLFIYIVFISALLSQEIFYSQSFTLSLCPQKNRKKCFFLSPDKIGRCLGDDRVPTKRWFSIFDLPRVAQNLPLNWDMRNCNAIHWGRHCIERSGDHVAYRLVSKQTHNTL